MYPKYPLTNKQFYCIQSNKLPIYTVTPITNITESFYLYKIAEDAN